MKVIDIKDDDLIKIAELAVGEPIKYPIIYKDDENENLEEVYIFVAKEEAAIRRNPEGYIRSYGLLHVQNKFEWIQIDSRFNITIKSNYILNMVEIYEMLRELGVKSK